MSLIQKIFALYGEHKKPIVLGVLAVFVLSLPIVISQVLRSQDIRQKAAAGDPVTLTFSPSSGQKNINDEFDVQLLINTNTNDISAIDGYLKYYDNILQLVSVTPGEPYTKIDIVPESYAGSDGIHVGVQHVILYNQTAAVFTGSAKIAVTFRFKALASGSAPIGFGSNPRDNTKILKIAASGFAGNVPITNTSLPVMANFTIETLATSTPTATQPTATPTTVQGGTNAPNAPTVTLSPSATPTVTQGPTATQNPTATSMPTATIPVGGTGIQIVASIPGIGLSDGENHQPLHPDRTITVVLSNFTTKAQIGSPIQSSLKYDPASGKFKGTVNLGASFTTGTYDVKIKMDNTLFKKQQGITITAGLTTNQFPSTFTLVPSDLDQDNRISISDYTIGSACVREPILPACTSNYISLADINDNGTNDVLDMVILQRGFSTPIEGD